MRALNRFLDLLEKICLIVATLAVALMVVLNIVQVFFRYALNAAFVWVFPVTMLLFIWMTFLGAFVVYRRKKDIVVSFIANLVPGLGRAMLTLATNILILLFLLLILLEAPKLISHQTSIMQVVPLPRYFQAIPLFIGVAGIFLDYLIQTVASVKTMCRAADREGPSPS
jgi:TRAP-type C4-dicarboxylate transport system permease small subunit